ncbi:HNH endonuclease [Micrococcus luteus]|nr:HNH endonuclease [Micrococcus luteus]
MVPKSGRKRLRPVDATTRELYVYSGNQCAYTDCTDVLLQQNGNWNCEVAHIYGVMPGSARGNHNLTNEELRKPSNLLLLCPSHHNEIDNKNLESTYTVDVVRDMKVQHESKFKTALLGLERIIDGTAGQVVKRPENLCALDGFCSNLTELEIQENVELAAPFVEALVGQPAALRDVISLVLCHGRVENHWGADVVRATTARIEAASSSITTNELWRRAKSLEHDGLLSIDDDDGLWYFVLIDPTAKGVGWDIFVAIHKLAAGRSDIIRRIINDLDFSVMDE